MEKKKVISRRFLAKLVKKKLKIISDSLKKVVFGLKMVSLVGFAKPGGFVRFRNQNHGFGQNRSRNPMGFGKPKLKPKLTPNI